MDRPDLNYSQGIRSHGVVSSTEIEQVQYEQALMKADMLRLPSKQIIVRARFESYSSIGPMEPGRTNDKEAYGAAQGAKLPVQRKARSVHISHL